MQFARGGGLLSPKSYVDVPAGPRKSDFLYTIFLPNFPPISIPFLKEKHPILTKLGAFYSNLPKIHPIYVIWAPSSLMKTPRSLYQFLRKSAPKGRHIHVYHVNVRTPPPGQFAPKNNFNILGYNVTCVDVVPISRRLYAHHQCVTCMTNQYSLSYFTPNHQNIFSKVSTFVKCPTN